jgi:TldD protein
MTTALPAALRAPFAAGGATAIDAQLANKLLGIALEAGGDYADIYFEFRVSADYALEEEQVRTLGRGITLGLGVRVTRGDATDKLALLRAADRAARAYDKRIVKVEASFVESIKEILLFTSDGRMATDIQPILRFGVRAVAEENGKRQAGSSGGGGRYRHGVLRAGGQRSGEITAGGGADRHRDARRARRPRRRDAGGARPR